MTIARILAAKGGDVVTTQPHRTLTEVAEVLVAKNMARSWSPMIKAASLAFYPNAILFVRSPSAAPLCSNDAVSMHMTAEVITTSEDERVHVAMEKMTNGRFRHLPVIRHERLVGLVSIGDLVKHRLAEYEYEQKVTREYIATA
jgi:hypothetical protein